MGYKTHSCYSALNNNANGDQKGGKINPHPSGGLLEAEYFDFTPKNELSRENEAVGRTKGTNKRMS